MYHYIYAAISFLDSRSFYRWIFKSLPKLFEILLDIDDKECQESLKSTTNEIKSRIFLVNSLKILILFLEGEGAFTAKSWHQRVNACSNIANRNGSFSINRTLYTFFHSLFSSFSQHFKTYGPITASLPQQQSLLFWNNVDF